MEAIGVARVLKFALLSTSLIAFEGAIGQDQPGSPGALICSTLEVKIAERMGVTLATFHQANKGDGPRLGELLRQNDGASVEFETSDGRTHRATLLRLGSCFGRGLLVFPAGSAHLTAREQFWLRFPQASKSS